MTKNKKKLRRAERRYSVTKSAQTLVLAGMLLAGGVTGAMATDTSVKDLSEWNTNTAAGQTAITAGNNLKVTPTSDADVAITTANDLTSLGGLIIEGANSSADHTAKLTVNSNLSFNEAVSIKGSTSALAGKLIINEGKTFTSNAGTTLTEHGGLEIAGTHAGDVHLNSANSTLASAATTGTNIANIDGQLKVTEGAVTVNLNNLTIGSLLLDGSTVTPAVTVNNSKALTVGGTASITGGTLELGSTTAGDLKLAEGVNLDIDSGSNANTTAVLKSNGGANTSTIYGDVLLTKGTLDLSGKMAIVQFNDSTKGGTLTLTGDSVLKGAGTNSELTVGTLKSISGTAFEATNGALQITADKLDLSAATSFGSSASNSAFTLVVTGNEADFLNQDITVKGYASNFGTLQLGTTGMTGTATTAKNITLLGAVNSNEALLNVDYGTFEVGNIYVGSATDVASGATGTITVANGGTLKANTINLYGLTGQVAKLDLANTASKSQNVEVGTLNVGGANTYGTVTMAGNAAGTPSTLTVNTALNVGTNGIVTVGANGILDASTLSLTAPAGQINIVSDGLMKVNNLNLAGTKLVDTVGGGSISVKGALHVKDTLSLTGGNITTLYTGKVITSQLALDATTNTHTQNTGTLALLGKGKELSFFNGQELIAAGTGKILFGDTVAAHEALGGTYAGKVTAGVASGGLTVNAGNWTLSGVDAAHGLIVTAADAVQVRGGTLNVGYWDSKTTSAGTGSVEGGTLNFTGGAGTIITSADSDIKASNAGVITAKYAAVLTNDTTTVTDVKKFNVTDTGVLIIKDRTTTTISLTDYGTLKGALMTGTGALRLEGVKITGLDANTTLTQVAGVSVPDDTVKLSSTSDTLSAYGTEVKGLVGTGADNTLAITNGGLTLVGDSSNKNFQLSQNGDFKTDITITGASDLLNLGMASENSSLSYGKLKGDITLSNAGAKLNATNGEFSVSNLVATTANDGAITLHNAALSTTGNAGTSGNALGSVKTDATSSLLAAGDMYINAAELQGGELKTTGANSTLSVTTATIKGEQKSFITASKDMTIGKFTDGITDGKLSNATITAKGDMTVGADGINGSKNTIMTGGDLTLTGSGLKVTESFVDVTGAHTLSGNSSVSEGSTLTVGTLDISTHDLTIGKAGEAEDGSHLTSTNTTLGTGTLEVLNATASLGTVDASAAGKLFIDPAYVNIAGTTGNIGASLLMGKEGVLTVGALDQAWVQKAIKDSGAATDSSVLALQKTLTLASGGTIVVDKGVDKTGAIGVSPVSKIHFGDKSLLALDGSKFLDATKSAIVAGGGTFYTSNTTGEAAKLHITGIKTGDTVHVISGLTNNTIDLDDDSKSWQNENITFDTQLFKGEGSTNTDKNAYTVNVKSVGAHNIFPQMSSSMSGLVDQVMGQYGLQTDSTNAGVRFVSRAVSDSYGLGGNNAERAAATIEGAAQLAVVGAAPAMTLSAVQAGTSTVTTRTSFASPLMDSSKAVALHKDVDGTLSVDSGLNAGNGMKNGFGLWIMPLYQSNSAWGMKADGFKGGYKSDLGGVALGADYTFNDMFRLGLAFNIGGGYAESNGDFNKTENSFNFWGINAYGGWTMNNFGITADVGYTGNYNKLQQELPSGMGMSDIKSDVNSSAWTAGLRGEYKFQTEALDIIPHVGVRYTGLTTDEYKAKSGGDTVFKVDQSFQSIWTFPIGVTLAKEIETGSGWIIRPQVDLGITPATGDVKAKSKVRIPGVDAQAEMKMQVVDYMSYDGGVGLEMKKDNVSFGINYNIQASEHRTGHGVFGTFRYEF